MYWIDWMVTSTDYDVITTDYYDDFDSLTDPTTTTLDSSSD